MMTARKIYLPGSLPPEVMDRGDTGAMEWVMHQMERANGNARGADAELMAMVCDQDDRWIIEYMDNVTLRDEAFAVIRDGNSADYDDMPIVKPIRKLRPQDVSMFRIVDIKAMINAHRQLGLAGKIPLQLSFPNRLDLALFLFVGRLQFGRWHGIPTLKHPWRTLRGIWYTLRYLPVFKEAQQQEINQIEEIDTNGVIRFNVESPAVLYALNLVPKFMRRMVSWLLAKQIAGVLNDLPMRGTVLHLCYGNLDDTEVIQPGTIAEPVMFIRSLARQTSDRPFVHIPCAYGNHPAPTDPGYYKALRKVGPDWKLIAGVVDEHALKGSREALIAFETALRRPAYGIGPACGYGRHSELDAKVGIQVAASIAPFEG